MTTPQPTPACTPAPATCSWGDVTLTHTIVNIARVEQQARQAAHQSVDVNDACPYPFQSTAGYIFKNEFEAERTRILMPPEATPCPK